MLLKKRSSPQFDWIDATTLAIYALLLAWTVWHHEPWADESQAWLLARDSSFRELVFRRMHYEGTPVLWQTILWALVRLHLPFAAFPWVAAGFALTGVFVLVRYAPLPRIFSITIPFTFFLAYQYAAVARDYVLFPLLLFLVCILYAAKQPKPTLFAFVAGLFANLTTHAFVLSIVFAVLYGCQRAVRQRNDGAKGWYVRLGIAAALFALLAGFAAIVAAPAPDVGFAVESKVGSGPLHRLLLRFIPPEQLPPGAPALDPSVFSPDPSSPPHGALVGTVWAAYNDLPTAGLPAKLLGKAVLILSAATFPVSESNLLACSFLLLAMLWLWSRRSLSLLLPYAALLCFFAVVWVYVHHTGLSLLALLAAVWIASDRPQTRGPRWISPAFAAVSLLVISLQIGWTAYAVHRDTEEAYDPGKETYDFLSQHFPRARLASFVFEAEDVQPYASHNLFLNQPHSFRVFSASTNTDRRRTEATAEKPDVIVDADLVSGDETIMNQWLPIVPSWQHIGHGILDYWEANGFHETHRFCGYRPFRFGISNIVCDVILERNG